jgi:hypothetical protein
MSRPPRGPRAPKLSIVGIMEFDPLALLREIRDLLAGA